MKMNNTVFVVMVNTDDGSGERVSLLSSVFSTRKRADNYIDLHKVLNPDNRFTAHNMIIDPEHRSADEQRAWDKTHDWRTPGIDLLMAAKSALRYLESDGYDRTDKHKYLVEQLQSVIEAAESSESPKSNWPDGHKPGCGGYLDRCSGC
jgi:hypothetical protein